ncbi:hypothetical protein ON010_g13374 [Phytophthora cinnamomi]|nr:hypothetical protein ON010_g13374 [Phytophthora cinnamomi]
MQQAAAPSTGDGDDADRKSKLLALLDRARVNRGLQPELNGQLEALDDSPLPIKSEPTEPPLAPSSRPHPQELRTPKCTCSHSLQPSPASSNAHNRVPSEDRGLPAAGRRNGTSDDSTMPHADSSGSNGAVASTGSIGNGSNSHYTTDSEASGDVPMKAEADGAQEHPRVAVLSSTPKPRIADLTGGRSNTPRLQQLRALEEPRNNSHHTHPDPQTGAAHTGRVRRLGATRRFPTHAAHFDPI